ncbi:conserved hypothetical protein [Gloeothece citriformis PCC 7424]|uniref:Uncharacterized protein n=1 Tax=Gloeothece citriformis (strain PCC 7424) TaxID=65393 RepID=B7KAP8_GLOC7|nr:hypothetical protein [Gloeothece citriformis]ACK68720.1 conserved hypothetical protein [Gloeothece citriformis PCC 7424]
MSFLTLEQHKEQIIYPSLPLAVYRELAAHLEQIEGITTQLIPQTSEQFDYNDSQIRGILIDSAPDLEERSRQQVKKILDYYARRYGQYKRDSSPELS